MKGGKSYVFILLHIIYIQFQRIFEPCLSCGLVAPVRKLPLSKNWPTLTKETALAIWTDESIYRVVSPAFS